MKKIKLYSYVVEHDNGFAPNPFHGYCTLAHCKFKTEYSKRRNIIEMAKECFDNDYEVWVLGTGGCSKESTGLDTLVYLMRITEILTLRKYYDDSRFIKKRPTNYKEISKLGDNLEFDYNGKEFSQDRLVIISKTFWYFGKNAINIPEIFFSIQKRGRSYKCNFESNLDQDFLIWFQKFIATKHKTGLIGNPKTFSESNKSKYKYKNESNTSPCRNR